MSLKHTPSAEARDLRDLLEAVLEAVTLPYDTPDHDQRLVERASWARATVKGALQEDLAGIGWDADYLRSKLAIEDAQAAERDNR